MFGTSKPPESPESPGSDDVLPGGRRFEAEPPDGDGMEGIDAVEPGSPGRDGIEGPPDEEDELGIEGAPDDGDDEGLGIDGPPDDEDEGDELGIDGMPPLDELCCCVDSQPARTRASADAPSQWIMRTDRPEECCVFMMASVSMEWGGTRTFTAAPITAAHIARTGRLSSDFGRNRSTPARAAATCAGIISPDSRVQPEPKLKM